MRLKHPQSGKSYDIKHHLTCNSEWAIYVLWCPCQLLYVGETTCTIKTRMNGHRYSIRKHRADLPMSKHFSEQGHSEWDLRFMVIDTVPKLKRGGNRLATLKKLELQWIHKLQTLKPKGMNVEFKVSSDMFK